MTFRQQLPPQKIDAHVLAFCEKLCPGEKPVWVPVRPEPWSKMLDCFPNVIEKVRVSGGSLVHGWQISEIPKVHLEAQFHGVWRSPGGALIDVTREEFSQPRILFVIDHVRKYTGPKLQNERFSLGRNDLVEKYWALTDKMRERQEAFLIGGFGLNHPAVRQELSPLAMEIFSIHEELEKEC